MAHLVSGPNSSTLAGKPKSTLQEAQPEEEVANCLRATVVTTVSSEHSTQNKKKARNHVSDVMSKGLQ